MLTNGQKKALHVAAKQAGVPEDMRRTIQHQIGGFHSAADRLASRYGFICCMAFYEDRAGGSLAGCTPGYWAGERERENPESAVRHAILAEMAALGWTRGQLDEWAGGPHMSGAGGGLDGLSAYWLGRVLQGLKAMRARQRRTK